MLVEDEENIGEVEEEEDRVRDQLSAEYEDFGRTPSEVDNSPDALGLEDFRAFDFT